MRGDKPLRGSSGRAETRAKICARMGSKRTFIHRSAESSRLEGGQASGGGVQAEKGRKGQGAKWMKMEKRDNGCLLLEWVPLAGLGWLTGGDRRLVFVPGLASSGLPLASCSPCSQCSQSQSLRSQVSQVSQRSVPSPLLKCPVSATTASPLNSDSVVS